MFDFIKDNITEITATVAIIVSVGSLIVAWISIQRVRIQSLFAGFQQANQATLDYPVLLNSVHGLNMTEEECREIAYLSVLMDSFQHGHCSYTDSSFLDKITSIPGNREKWGVLKSIYYGEFDLAFIDIVDKKFNVNCRQN